MLFSFLFFRRFFHLFLICLFFRCFFNLLFRLLFLYNFFLRFLFMSFFNLFFRFFNMFFLYFFSWLIWFLFYNFFLSLNLFFDWFLFFNCFCFFNLFRLLLFTNRLRDFSFFDSFSFFWFILISSSNSLMMNSWATDNNIFIMSTSFFSSLFAHFNILFFTLALDFRSVNRIWTISWWWTPFSWFILRWLFKYCCIIIFIYGSTKYISILFGELRAADSSPFLNWNLHNL